jgi:zinc/manganese transport system substrate-binding protein
MRRLTSAYIVSVLTLGLLAGGAEPAGKIRVVATLPDLKALAEAVGSDLVQVESLARGTQNAHDVEVRPSLMVKLRRAELLIVNGLDLDYWADPLVQGSNNARLIRGGIGQVDASRGIPLLEVPTGRVDRSMGDVHPQGNPHYTLDPDTVPIVTANILEGLARVAPEHRGAFEKQRRQFLDRLNSARERWTKLLEPFKGAKVITYHNTWIYFLSRFGLALAGTVEDRPGIPPSPPHLATLIRTMKEQKIRLLIAEPFSDRRVAELVAREAGAKLLVLPPAVGGVKGVNTYLDLFEHNVAAIANALR